MKTVLSIAAFVLAAGMLFAAETNYYNNPEYKTKTDKKGKFRVIDHWYEGNVTIKGDYNGSPAARLEQVKVNWGGFHAALVIGADTKQKFKPGKYTFSVWCKPEGVPTDIYLIRTVQPATGAKRIRTIKTYKGADLPPVGKWTELVMDFEFKPGESMNSCGVAVYSTKTVGPKVVLFAKPRITLESED